MEEPCFDGTNVPIARRLTTGKMNALTTRNQHQSLNKTAPGKKTGWQPEPEAQDLIG
jgi:hypothetical protein